MRLLPFVVLLVGLALPAAADPVPAQMTVTGEGRSIAAPDMASLNLGVVTRGLTAAEALGANSAALAAVLARLAADGIASRDIQTSGLSVSARYDYSDTGEGRVLGYDARNMVTVRVRDLPALGALIDAAFAAGTNEFNGLSFGLADDRAATDAARRAAVADARARAALYAEAAGVSLGRIVTIAESAGNEVPQPMSLRAASLAAAPPVPVAEGELSIAAQITIVFEISQ
ncbi:MAG: SIMPL domain-containing protein [Rhodobacteraceae bacterium]|nr:SIMPL domain-containing protein [Paracoccaceae bacterium]